MLLVASYALIYDNANIFILLLQLVLSCNFQPSRSTKINKYMQIYIFF